MASILGSVSGPQNGGRFVGKILVTGRKIARGSMVSARTRQKFSMPLLFHGFAAPQALVLDALRTFMATHVLEQFKNRCGHKRSQDVENNCWRRCKTMGTQWPAVCKTSVAYLRKQSKLALLFARRQKFCRQTAPVLGSRNPKRGPSRDTSKSN